MKVAIPLFALLVAPMFSSAFYSNERIDIGGNTWYTKFEPSPVFKRSSQYQEPEDSKTVDLHKGEFCVDVSTYGPVQYDKKAFKGCDTTFIKNCEDRTEQVTISVLMNIEGPAMS